MSSVIYLIGFRGSGKTTIGSILSKKIKYIFNDTDYLIQKKYKNTISEIVNNYGWNKFRQIESKILQESTKNAKVIATGGGIILNKENCIFMRSNGKIFYLQVSPKILQLRLLSDPKKHQRPSLSSLSKDDVSYILPKRILLYEKTAHVIINANNNSNMIVKDILKNL